MAERMDNSISWRSRSLDVAICAGIGGIRATAGLVSEFRCILRADPGQFGSSAGSPLERGLGGAHSHRSSWPRRCVALAIGVALLVPIGAGWLASNAADDLIAHVLDEQDLGKVVEMDGYVHVPRRMRNRVSPKPKRQMLGTLEQGERLSLALVVKDLSKMRRVSRASFLGAEPVPGYQLAAMCWSRRSGIFAARMWHEKSRTHFIVFSAANAPGDFLDGGRFSRQRRSDQHSIDLLIELMGALHALEEDGALRDGVHFSGHSLGGSIAIYAAAWYGVPGAYTVFNALGIQDSILGVPRHDFTGTAVFSSRDMLRFWNRLNGLEVPGQRVELRGAGLHRSFALCRHLAHCREPVWDRRDASPVEVDVIGEPAPLSEATAR